MLAGAGPSASGRQAAARPRRCAPARPRARRDPRRPGDRRRRAGRPHLGRVRPHAGGPVVRWSGGGDGRGAHGPARRRSPWVLLLACDVPAPQRPCRCS
ncbi:hypothetical protein NKG05_15860 [Oerskovia sp. M15]